MNKPCNDFEFSPEGPGCANCGWKEKEHKEMEYTYFQLEYFQGTGHDLWLQVDQILEDNFMGVNASYHQLTGDELMEIPAESVGELSLYFTVDVSMTYAQKMANVMRKGGIRVKEIGTCSQVNTVDELFAQIYNNNQEEMIMKTPQMALISDVRIKLASHQCQALKADGTQCTYKPSEWVDGPDFSAHVCGTHANYFHRHGEIKTAIGSISATDWELCDWCQKNLEIKDLTTVYDITQKDSERYPMSVCSKCKPTLGDSWVARHEISVSQEADNKVTNQVADNNKEETVDNGIYMFTKEEWFKGSKSYAATPRIITSYLKNEVPEGAAPGFETEAERYPKSLKSHKPYNNLLALITGNWHTYLLQERLLKRGYGFRAVIYSNKEIREICEIGCEARIRKMHEEATFSGASDSHTYFLFIEGVNKHGLEAMGIRIKDVPKIAKRLTEVFRITELFWYSPDDKSLRIRMFDAKRLLNVRHYDGANIMTKSTALRMTHVIPDVKRRRTVRRQIRNEELTRVNARLIFPLGLIKGDWLIVDDNDEWDVLVHPENIKGEFASDGWMSLTAEPHHPWHMAVWDDQSWINNPTLLPYDKQISDLDWMISDIKESIDNGEVPDWLLLGDDAHLDDGTPDLERLSELMHRQYIRWQVAGLDIKASDNQMFMAFNGVLLRMSKFAVYHKGNERARRIRYFKKTWTPMTNAFLAGVMTREVVEDMAGMVLPETDSLLWDARIGLIMSGERFDETFDLHGTWDLDDSVKVILIKVFSSDLGKLARMINTKVLDWRIEVPKTAEDAIPVALLVRSPNGPGEYSIEKLPTNWQDFPWFKFNKDTIPVVDLATAPNAQSELLENVKVTGMPTSLTFTGKPLTKSQCWDMIEAQRFNPGIGAECNSLMNWVRSFGPSFPDEMLEVLGEMVDATQQGRDPISFDAVAKESDNTYAQMIHKLETEGGRVDRLLTQAHLVPPMFRQKMEPYMSSNGRFTQYNLLYLEKYNYLLEELRNKTRRMRATVPLVREYYTLNVKPETMRWAADFNTRYTTKFKANDYAWPTITEETNPFAKMHYQFQKSEVSKRIVKAAVEELRAFEGDEVHKRVLVLWHYLITPTNKNPQGLVDRVIFQPGEDESVMDLLIEALRWHGKIS